MERRPIRTRPTVSHHVNGNSSVRSEDSSDDEFIAALLQGGLPPFLNRPNNTGSKVSFSYLPPSMSQKDFIAQFGPLPKNNYFFYKPPLEMGMIRPSCTAVINFLHKDELKDWFDKLDGLILTDDNGEEHVIVAEIMLTQDLPKVPVAERDELEGTLEDHPEFQAFSVLYEETDGAFQDTPIPVEDLQKIMLNEIEERKAKTRENQVTPLVAYIMQKNKEEQEKARIIAEVQDDARMVFYRGMNQGEPEPPKVQEQSLMAFTQGMNQGKTKKVRTADVRDTPLVIHFREQRARLREEKEASMRAAREELRRERAEQLDKEKREQEQQERLAKEELRKEGARRARKEIKSQVLTGTGQVPQGNMGGDSDIGQVRSEARSFEKVVGAGRVERSCPSTDVNNNGTTTDSEMGQLRREARGFEKVIGAERRGGACPTNIANTTTTADPVVAPFAQNQTSGNGKPNGSDQEASRSGAYWRRNLGGVGGGENRNQGHGGEGAQNGAPPPDNSSRPKPRWIGPFGEMHY